MRTISASNPSSLKKPFCCANGNTIQCTTCCGTPTLILSAPRATPQRKDKIVTAAIRTPFIAPLQSAGSLGKYQRPEKLPRGRLSSAVVEESAWARLYQAESQPSIKDRARDSS